MFGRGQIWTDSHIRYQCTSEGTTKVLGNSNTKLFNFIFNLGCIDDDDLFIDLGRDILLQGIVHRCYKINTTTFYHR